MKTQVIDFRKILAPYSNCWVALSSDERKVVNTAKTAKKAYEGAQKKGESTPVMMRVPKEYGTYVL